MLAAPDPDAVERHPLTRKMTNHLGIADNDRFICLLMEGVALGKETVAHGVASPWPPARSRQVALAGVSVWRRAKSTRAKGSGQRILSSLQGRRQVEARLDTWSDEL